MFINYLKITLRNFFREKLYALINILGLSLGIASCLILGLWLHSELTYDRHNVRHNQIFRVVSVLNMNGKIHNAASTSQVLGPMLAEEYPEIKAFVRFFRSRDNLLFWHGDKAFYWDKIYTVDPNIFEVFTHDIVFGDPKIALVDPTSIAVSESFAKKYFGDANPIGETIANDDGIYKITLVFADLPENSHLKYDALFSFKKIELDEQENVTLRNNLLLLLTTYTYLLMPEGYDIQNFKKISDSFYARHMAERGRALNVTWGCWLQPLADIHLHSDLEADLPTSNKLYIYTFTAVALFIILVACINYMNLATARATRRSKEVGMRKILGSSRMQLMLQFLSESILCSLIALLFGIILVEVILKLPIINELLSKNLALNISHRPSLLGLMLIFSLIVGLISGSYPALYLSSMQPMSALKHNHRTGKGSIRMRELLVMLQFTISVIVIACVSLMALQMRYVAHKSLGFNKENRVVINLYGKNLIEKIPIIKKELSKNSNILGVSVSNTMLGQNTSMMGGTIENNDGGLESITLNNMIVDENFINVMGMQLVAGRDFSKKLLTDIGTSFIVNETLVKKMGWKDPLGKHIRLNMYNGRVIGVVKDFHFTSLHQQIESFVMYQPGNNPQDSIGGQPQSTRQFLFLHISGEDIPGTLAFLRNRFTEFDPRHPLSYEFLDDSLDRLYLSDQRAMQLIGLFAGICIFISCMGLFGLATFTTEQRTKEIGIRKVLGASSWQIIIMLSRRILLIVLGGAVVASLVAYFAIDEWLTGFAYRTGINPLVFLLSAFTVAGFAFITIALESCKTAKANPINALRYE